MNEEIKEEWRDVVGYEGLYQVSNTGKVKSIKRNQLIVGALTQGYRRVLLYKNGFRKLYGVHRLVAIAFIPNKNNLLEIDHIDGNPSNNFVSNLRWVTSSENKRNPVTYEKHTKKVQEVCKSKEYREKMQKICRSATHREKLKKAQEKRWDKLRNKIVCTETGEIWNSCKELADFLKVNISAVASYCRGDSWCKYNVVFANGVTVSRPHFKYIQNFKTKKSKNTKKVRCIETLQEWSSCRELALFLNEPVRNVYKYCNNIAWCNKTIDFKNGNVISCPHFEYANKEPSKIIPVKPKDKRVKKVKCIENNFTWDSATKLASFLKTDPSTAAHYCRGELLYSKTVVFPDGSMISKPHFEYIIEKEIIDV